MNLGEMETALKRFGFDANDPLKQWLNSAMHSIEMDRDWDFLESGRTESSTTVGGTSVSLPTTTSKVISVRDITNHRKLRHIGWWRFFREIDDPKEEGLPQYYTIPQGSSFINLWPIPNGIFTIEIISQLQTKDMENPGDNPKTGGVTGNWPAATSWAIVLQAAIEALFAENEEERAEKLNKQLEKELERLRRRFGARNMDESETVVDVQGYGSEVPEEVSI